jgi:hypothetical protein
LRAGGTNIKASGTQRVAQAMLQRAGFSGKGSIELGSPPSDRGPSYAITVRFDAEPRTPFTPGQGFPMPPGIRLLPFAGDYLTGPLFARNLPASEPTPCWSGAEVEELSLEPPPGKHFAALPADVKVATDTVVFSAHWSQSARTVSVRRALMSKIDQPLCSGALRQAITEALPKIAAAYPMQISLADD